MAADMPVRFELSLQRCISELIMFSGSWRVLPRLRIEMSRNRRSNHYFHYKPWSPAAGVCSAIGAAAQETSAGGSVGRIDEYSDLSTSNSWMTDKFQSICKEIVVVA
jgi:hypothetical protein